MRLLRVKIGSTDTVKSQLYYIFGSGDLNEAILKNDLLQIVVVLFEMTRIFK
jgi:hypothetical protein